MLKSEFQDLRSEIAETIAKLLADTDAQLQDA